MIQLNLLPDIKREYIKARRTQAKVVSIAILVCMVSVGLLVLAILWVYGVQNIQKSTLTKSIEKRAKELKDTPDLNKYITVQNQLANISLLHSDKPLTSRIFDIMPRLNPKAPNNVRITSVDIDTATTTMLLEGETASFTGLETFRDTLRNASVLYTTMGAEGRTTEPLFTSGSVQVLSQGLGKKEDGSSIVSFKISTTYNTKAFARDTTSLDVSVPNMDTTQSKQDTPDVFGASQAVKEER